MSATTKIQQDKNQFLYTYWNNLRSGRKAPHRFEIEPAQIAGVLPHTFILQHEKKDHYDFRLAGTEICHEFCFELKQNNLLDFWAPKDREAVRNILTSVEQEAAIGCVEFTAQAVNGQTLEYEMLLLPLYHNNMHISRMLGGMVAKSKPYWVGTSRLEAFKVQKVRLFWPENTRKPEEVHHTPVDNTISILANLNYKVVTTKDRKFRVYEGGRDNS